MKKEVFGLALCAMLFALSVSAGAQQTGKVPRIGFLDPSTASGTAGLVTQLDAKGLESAFQTAKQKQVGAIMTITGRRFFAERKRIVELAGKYRLPAIYPEGVCR